MKSENLWTVSSADAETLFGAKKSSYPDTAWPKFNFEASSWEYLVHVSEEILSETYGDRRSSHNEIRPVLLSDCVIFDGEVIGFVPGGNPENFGGKFLKISLPGEKISSVALSSGEDKDIFETFSLIEK